MYNLIVLRIMNCFKQNYFCTHESVCNSSKYQRHGIPLDVSADALADAECSTQECLCVLKY